jgi:hypothetical protein
MRFDVPVIGTKTLETAADAGIKVVGVEAGSTLLLNRPLVCETAARFGIAIHGL